MDLIIPELDLGKLRRKLRRMRRASLAAIELADYRAVARLTCAVVRLQDTISVAEQQT
jgi:hypothetical protein